MWPTSLLRPTPLYRYTTHYQPTATYSTLPLHCPLLAVEPASHKAEPWRGLRRRAPL